MAGGEDITLRIGGDAEGAKRAAAEAKGAVEGLGQAAGQTAGPVGAAGAAGEEAGKGFDFGRREAARLAQTLLYTTGIGGQFAGSLTYLVQAALNPATLGFAAAVIAVQGIAAAFRAAAAETEAEKRRMEELVRTYAEAAQNLEAAARARDKLTEAGAKEVREAQFAAGGAGMPLERAAEFVEALEEVEPGLPLEEVRRKAKAFVGRPSRHRKMTAEQFARRFRGGRKAEEEAAWAAEGTRRAVEYPALRTWAAEAGGAREAEAAIPERQKVAADLAKYLRIKPEEAEQILATYYAEPSAAGFLPHQRRRYEEEAVEKVSRFAKTVGWEREAGGGYRIEHYHGMEVHQHFAGHDGRNILADGRPRGPGQ